MKAFIITVGFFGVAFLILAIIALAEALTKCSRKNVEEKIIEGVAIWGEVEAKNITLDTRLEEYMSADGFQEFIDVLPAMMNMSMDGLPQFDKTKTVRDLVEYVIGELKVQYKFKEERALV